MGNPVDYQFYTDVYLGNSIAAKDFPRVEARAAAQLAQYQRKYTVTGTQEQLDTAVCSMADAIFFFEQVQSGAMVASCAVGSVSSTFAVQAPDCSPKAQASELYRCARQHLRIYRGVG